jgi:hypothetical protein
MLNAVMLSVANKPFILCVFMLNAVMLNAVMLNVVVLNVVAPVKLAKSKQGSLFSSVVSDAPGE